MTNPRELLKEHIQDIAHVGFVVSNMQDAIDSACRVYGLAPQDIEYQPDPVEEALTRFAFFQVGGLSFEYIEPVSDFFRDMLLGMPSGGGGINHVAWAVEDIEGALALLMADGIKPGHVTPDGIVQIGEKKMVYLDPATTDGLVIELIEFPPSP